MIRLTTDIILVLTCSFIIVFSAVESLKIEPSCDSLIYCQGDLLHDVQTQKIFNDSKTFVDLKLKFDEKVVLGVFEKLKKQHGGQLPNDQLSAFVQKYFIDCETDPSCKELLPWSPKDWLDNPSFLSKIKDAAYKQWAFELHKIWKTLARTMDPQVKKDAKYTSLIYVPNGFIIPGGRFHEVYYWDSFWVIKGLLISGMANTAKGMINNFLELIKTLGHIPNGSRWYYVQRSQPPLLTHMVEAYVKSTGDKDIIKDSLHLLDREMEYFISNRQVNVKKGSSSYRMFRYFAVSSGPRPESYREDYQNAQTKKTDVEKTNFYIALKSGAESGWDFSSRWFIKDKTNNGTLLDINTQDIIPVELNAILHKNFRLLAEWYTEIGPKSRALYFKNWADNLQIAINEVLWNQEDGIWYDYDNVNEVVRKYYYVSNFAPLWTESYTMDKKNLTDKMVNYMIKSNLDQYLGGPPASKIYSGEQWDYPDAWPPLISFIIEGLNNLGEYTAQDTAYSIAFNWVQSNYAGYKKYGKMFEKYNALNPGEPGSGGEYTDQDGFGWTNGLILELLDKYGSTLLSGEAENLQELDKLLVNDVPEVIMRRNVEN